MPESPMFSVANWGTFQHYRDRNPPWIKLHFSLLTSRDWVMLDDASRVLAVACMLIASRNDGQVPADPEYMQRVAYLNSPPDFKPLLDAGFLILPDGMLANASDLQADACSETEESREETETEAELPPEARQCADLLKTLILENDEKARIPGDLTAWADAIDKLHRIDGRDWDEIESVIKWCQSDGFWWKNILSGSKLRKQFTQLRAASKEIRPRPAGKEKWREGLEPYDG